MTKKIIASVLALMLFGGLVACADVNTDSPPETDSETETGGKLPENPEKPETPETPENPEKPEDSETPDEPDPVPTTVALNSSTKGIKILGERALVSDTQINCDWTCSGIEFTLASAGGSLTFKANSDKPCYFRAYVDGIAWSDLSGSNYFEVNGQSERKLSAIPKGSRTVRLIKVSGHTLARAELTEMTYYGTLSETAPENKELYMEFIGDSITCGWGVIKANDGTYKGQDGALAYPYLLAEEYDADYSMTALSGQGIIFHGTTIPNMTEGYLLTSPLRDGEAVYGFERKADVVVINMGTNDFYQRDKTDPKITEEAFKEAYKALIETVREKNGADCKIICLYNTMNDTFGSAIPSVCGELGGQRNGIYSFKLERTASGHPSAAENVAYAEAIKTVIDNALNGIITEIAMTEEANGEGMTSDFVVDFKPRG